MKKVLVTGSCGFIFSNFMIQNVAFNQNYKFVSVDKILAEYNLNNIYTHPDHTFYMGDIADEQFMENVFKLEKPHYVIHGAAESFVDDSIASAKPFIHSNVVGTQNIVDLSVKYGVEKFIYISTDEVYGQLEEGSASWTELSATSPRNPYSASKLAGELIVRAAGETHNLPYNITRSCNNYGPRQPPRNLVPKIITSILRDTAVPIHGSGKQYREWIYVLDHCSAILTILEKASNKEIYNIGSGIELRNLEMVEWISKYMNKEPKINFIKDRPGHDFRYSVNCEKLKSLGWQQNPYPFENCMRTTIKWYMANQDFYK